MLGPAFSLIPTGQLETHPLASAGWSGTGPGCGSHCFDGDTLCISRMGEDGDTHYISIITYM